MKRWLGKAAAKPVGDPNTMRLVGMLQQLADDPAMTEGGLRGALREASRVMAAQDELIGRLRRGGRLMAIHFAMLAALWALLFAYQTARLLHWL